MAGDPKQQHTLSRFYIARFGDSAEKPRKNPHVWYYPLDEPPPRAWRRERAKQISVREDYYTQPGVPDDKKYGLEKALKLSEDWAAEPIAKICDGRDPTPADIHAVALFATTTMGRAPAQIEPLGDFHAGILRNAMRLLYKRVKADPEQHSGVLEEMRAKGLDTSDLQNPEHFNPDRVRFEPIPAAAARALLEVGTDMAPRLVGMRWLVLHTSKQSPFITSDAPLCISSNGRLRSGQIDPAVEITFPLSSTVALYLREDQIATNGGTLTVFEDHSEADLEIVHLTNLRTVRRARSFILSSAPLFPGHDEIIPRSAEP